MKFAAAMISMLSAPLSGRAGRAMLRLGVVFLGAVLVFSAGFQVMMALEGREFSWWTAVYWTLVTMTTLGFGDIVFESDPGRMYSVVVLISGALLILILLPFTFIQLVYIPWRAAVREARAPRSLPEDTGGHVILTGRGPIEEALMRRATTAGVSSVLVVEDPETAAALHDQGYRVLVGALDEPDTYRAARAGRAAMVLTARSDQANTNVAFTVREVTDAGTLVATANSKDSVDVLLLAGADHVLELGELLGRAFARRILAPTARSSTISTFANLVIAEASAAGTELAGRTLAELDLRERFGVSVVGLWNRGSLQTATPDRRIEESSVLLLAGTREQLSAYDEAFAPDDVPARDADDGHPHAPAGDGPLSPVVILGGGRVGRATARALDEAGVPCRVVEHREERVRHLDNAVIGNAADREVLERAGIDEAPAVVVTTHDDDTNIYLTLYCRRLRPDAEILGRVALDRNLSTMHRAGADFVLSYASVGSIEAWNTLRDDSTLLLTEGLVVFRVPVPDRLAGQSLRAADIPRNTGCSVIGVVRDGDWVTALDASVPLSADAQLVLIGDERSEERFYDRYVAHPGSPGLRERLQRLTGRD